VARSKKADDPGKMQRVADNLYRRGDTKTGTLIGRVWDPSKNGKGGKVNVTVRIAEHADYKTAVAAAKDAMRREQSAIDSRRRGGNGEETVASWAERWQDVVPNKRRESTRAHNRERVAAFVVDFGDRTLRDVAKARDECYLWITGGIALDSLRDVAAKWAGAKVESDGTVIVPAHRGNLAACRAMFTDAGKLWPDVPNPFAKMGLRSSPGRKKIQVLSRAELAELVAAAGRVHGIYGRYVFGPLIEIAAWTGLRPGELFALFPEDVDMERKRISVRRAINAKTDEGYTKTEGRDDGPVPLLPEAEDAFRRLEIDQLPQGQPIFRTTHGKPYTQRNHHYYWDPVRTAFVESLPEQHWLPKRIEEARRRAEAEGRPAPKSSGNLDFYELRHFFGSRLGEAGVSPYDIAKAMGHSDGGKLAMERYIHTDAEDAADRVLQRFGRVA
jgi:integrase